jgi:hypothetical protein
MGVPIVFHHVANQPHTPSPHFASFPTRTPRLSLHGSIFYLHLRSIMNPPFHPQSVCPSANLPSFHLPHTETHQWGPHPSSVFQANYALHGPPISHWGTRFCICTFLPKIIRYLLYKRLYFQSLHYLFVVTFGDLLPSFWPNATHVTLGWSITYHLPLPASSISSEYPTGHLPLPSEFVHLVPPLAQLITGLVVPLTLDLVTRLRPLFISYILQPRAVLSLPTS